MNQELTSIQDQIEVLRRREREIRDTQNDEYQREQAEYFDTKLKGKLFYCDGSIWSNYKDMISIIKVNNHGELHEYCSINCSSLIIRLSNEDYNAPQVVFNPKDQHRMDFFYKEWKLLTQEKFDELRKISLGKLNEFFDFFLPIKTN